MTTDREREDKRRWELLGILRSEPSWRECQEAADEMEILMRENEALRKLVEGYEAQVAILGGKMK